MLLSLRFVRRLAIVALAAAAACATEPRAPLRFERAGVAVEMAIMPATAGTPAAPGGGDTARVRFAISDTATGKPLRGLHPAAWFSRRVEGPAARPRTCAEKVQELLGGSIFSRAELDLNTFHVLALNDDATITVVDPLFGFGGTKLLALIPLPGVGADWALTPDGRRVYVSVPNAAKTVVIDTAAWTVAGSLDASGGTGRVALAPDGRHAWIAEAGGVAVVRTSDNRIVARLATGAEPHEIVFTADGRWAFVAHRATASLAVIDVERLAKAKDVPLDGPASSVAFSTAADAVYVAIGATGSVIAIDAAKHDVIARIKAGPGIGQLRFLPGGRFALVANPERDLVLVIDAATNSIVQRARVEQGPEQFAFSSDLAFVQRRGTAAVGMLPLKELGREGQPVAVAQFTGGEAAFGAPTSLGDRIVPGPGGAAVVVANPADKAIYYYMPGMAAPMGSFGNYERHPRAALVVDRSLRETAPGVYETTADLPAAGDYDAVFFLDSPRLTHCFPTRIGPGASPAKTAGSAKARLESLTPRTTRLIAGQPAQLRFQLRGELRAAPADLVVRAILAPGTWHSRFPARVAADGTWEIAFTPPQSGAYHFYAESAALGAALDRAPCLALFADAPPQTNTQ